MAPHTHSVCFVTCKGLANIFLVLVFLICLAGYGRYLLSEEEKKFVTFRVCCLSASPRHRRPRRSLPRGTNVAAARGTAVRHRVSVQPASVLPRAQAGGGAFCRQKSICGSARYTCPSCARPSALLAVACAGHGHAPRAVGHQLGQYRGQHQARVVRQSADRHGASLRLAACWRVALMPGLLRAGSSRRAGQLRQERQPLEPSGRLHQGRRGACGGCAPRMCAAPAFPALRRAPVLRTHTTLERRLPSLADELKRNFADKLTSLRLRLSSHACCQTHAPAQRLALHRGLWREEGCLVRAVRLCT